MVTVAQAVEKIIHRSRYLSEAISKNLINTSSLARYIKPELEKMLLKKVSDAAILMAINRLAKDIKPHYSSHAILTSAPEMILRSSLILSVYPDTPKYSKHWSHCQQISSFFCLPNRRILYYCILHPQKKKSHYCVKLHFWSVLKMSAP
jgi:hypothetical protein